MHKSSKYRQRQLIFDGNSLTANGASGVAYAMRYVTTCYNTIVSSGKRIALANYAAGSKRTAGLTTEFAAKIGAKCNPGDILVMMEITNEARDGLTAQQMYDNYVAYAQQARTYGLKVIMCTCPAGKFTTDPADTITRQQTCNALVLANNNTDWDATADVGALANLNSEAGITNGTYYNADQLHLTNAGYDLIPNAVEPVIQTFL